ncbi:M20/M25/M40 family metallo-hydrolase [Streptobacillus canis]|uniref:M20/M25/M40 family metallo-hydrolase n=1 Tax=Streptobacillus canis TaxID=2678686 RepID=UPI0012E199B1|nr:M20/M25/M40 family metallo-hydrolase [Streptobacillus canis]
MELLEKLSNSDAIASNEKEIRDICLRELKEEYFMDNLGSLIFKKGNGGIKILIAAHMDEVGYMVSEIEPKIKVIPIGNVAKVDADVKVTTRDNKKIKAKLNHETLELELDDKENIFYGDMVTFDTEFKELEENMIEGKSLDDRIGIYAAVEIFKNYDGENTLYLALTSSEEVGTRGAKTTADLIKPDIAFVIDVVSSKDGRRTLGKGPLIEFYDKNFIPRKGMIELMQQTFEECNLSYQMDYMRNGGTDATSIHLTQNGILTLVTCIPIIDCHYPKSKANINDIKTLIKGYGEVLKKVDEQQIQKILIT